MEGDLEQTEEMRDSKKEVLNRRISFWLSFTLAVVITFWYYATNPPDTSEMRKMRVFFKENIMDIAKFIRLPRELKGFADSKSHPFYQTYLKSSKPEKEKINMCSSFSPVNNMNLADEKGDFFTSCPPLIINTIVHCYTCH